jgi:NAD-dependent dihydropyrimidine dehydrogenase PreA subunit
MDNQLYIKNVVTLSYDHEKCTGCGMCVEVCPHGVFKIIHKKALITNRDKCMECGACQLNCKASAITVKSGVGCAAAVISGFFSNGEPTCGCSTSKSTCCN